MRGIGGTLFWLGLVSAVVHFARMELVVLMWMKELSPTVAWSIRGGLMLVGGLMWVVGRRRERHQPRRRAP